MYISYHIISVQSGHEGGLSGSNGNGGGHGIHEDVTQYIFSTLSLSPEYGGSSYNVLF